MTTQEAYKGIRQIESHYKFELLPKNLHPVWNDLLQLPAVALNHAVGEMQMIWKRPPTAREILDAVRSWALRLDAEVVEEEFAEGEAHFALTIGFLDGRISEGQYIKGLYSMAQKFGRPEYAAEASKREDVLRGKAT